MTTFKLRWNMPQSTVSGVFEKFVSCVCTCVSSYKCKHQSTPISMIGAHPRSTRINDINGVMWWPTKCCDTHHNSQNLVDPNSLSDVYARACPHTSVNVGIHPYQIIPAHLRSTRKSDNTCLSWRHIEHRDTCLDSPCLLNSSTLYHMYTRGCDLTSVIISLRLCLMICVHLRSK